MIGSWYRSRHVAAHLLRRLVLAQALIHDLAQQIVPSPGENLPLRDELGAHPMHAAEHEGRAEAGAARRREVKRHLVRGERLQPPPQALKLCGVEAAADT